MTERTRQGEERVISLMEEAERSLELPLPQEARFAQARFHEHLARRELERAWDEVAAAGVSALAHHVFWRNLADAASLLGLEERRAEADARARAVR